MTPGTAVYIFNNTKSAMINNSLIYISVFAFMSFTYIVYIVPYAHYAGYISDINNYKLLFSFIFISAFGYFSSNNSTVRSFFLNLFSIIYLIPFLVLFSFANIELIYLLYALLGYTILHFSSMIKIKLPVVEIFSTNFLIYTLLLASIISLIFTYQLNGGIFNFDLRKVYVFREIVNKEAPPIYGYITSISSKVVLPFLAVLSIYRKNWLLVVISIIFSFILFGLTGHRGVLLYTAISCFLFNITNLFRGNFAVNISFLLLLFLCCLDAILFHFFQGNLGGLGWVVDIIVRRGLFTPAFLDVLYMEYFTSNVPYFWSMSRITFNLIAPPYELAPPFQIGLIYFDKPTLAANVGFIGSGFSQAGIVGMALYALGCGLVIGIADSLRSRLPNAVVIALLFVQIATALTGADFVTMFLTHGLAVSLLLLMVINSKSESDPC